MIENIDVATFPALRRIWTFVAITFLFVPLRIFTRIRILEGFRADDYNYFVSFVCLLIYASFITNSAVHGLGKDLSEIHSPDDISRAVLDVLIGQTFLVIGNVTSKFSIACFLHNLAKQLVNTRIHKIAQWAPAAIFSFLVAMALLVSWLSCSPPAHLWDYHIEGHCTKSFYPIAYLAGAFSVFTDLCYAVYPWWLLWRKMLHPQKLVILSSLSLGIAAAGCGVKRAIDLPSLGSPNFTKDTLGLVEWHAAELAVTLIAIGIPICFPLYKGALDKLVSRILFQANHLVNKYIVPTTVFSITQYNPSTYNKMRTDRVNREQSSNRSFGVLWTRHKALKGDVSLTPDECYNVNKRIRRTIETILPHNHLIEGPGPWTYEMDAHLGVLLIADIIIRPIKTPCSLGDPILKEKLRRMAYDPNQKYFRHTYHGGKVWFSFRILHPELAKQPLMDDGLGNTPKTLATLDRLAPIEEVGSDVDSASENEEDNVSPKRPGLGVGPGFSAAFERRPLRRSRPENILTPETGSFEKAVQEQGYFDSHD
ncbi:hypothetical protein F4808DRAFT_469097 [Astrocystis sublimbata]|nr:hypothetical protein F4808DRAFT_469097 [Astrocystis sublimbata]